jgi:hypothetical protein
MSYLIYQTEQDALNRAEQEGVRLKLSYHKTGKGSSYPNLPVETLTGTWALDVSSYKLTNEERLATVLTFTSKIFEEEED